MLAAAGAFTIHAFFVLSPNLHEHHQLFEVPLLALAAATRPAFRPLFFAVSAIVAININYVYGAGLGMGWAIPRMITVVDISVVLAFVNVGVLVWFGGLLQQEAPTSSAVLSERGPRPPGTPSAPAPRRPRARACGTPGRAGSAVPDSRG